MLFGQDFFGAQEGQVEGGGEAGGAAGGSLEGKTGKKKVVLGGSDESNTGNPGKRRRRLTVGGSGWKEQGFDSLGEALLHAHAAEVVAFATRYFS